MKIEHRGYEIAEENLREAYAKQSEKMRVQIEQIGGG